MLTRRVAVATWRLARADRIEVEAFEQRATTPPAAGTLHEPAAP